MAEDTSASPQAADRRNFPAPHRVTFRAALAFWLKLGFISFGGPAGQIATMHLELVERRRWISERRFLHALNYCTMLPGPEAQQLATYIGWLLHGTWGGIVAGGLFVLPSLLILMALSAAYVAYGQVPAVAAVLYGVKPAVVAIVVAAVIRIGRRALGNAVLLAFAGAAFVGLAVFHVPFPMIVLAAGLLGYLGSKVWPGKFAHAGGHGGKTTKATDGESSPDEASIVIDDHHELLPHTRPNRWRFVRHALVGLVLWAAPLAVLVAWQGWHGTHARMGWFFTLAALVTFGGAYAVLPYVAQQAVEVFGWLRPGQMIDGLALGESTPGPLIMVVAFVGFVGGWQTAGQGWAGAVLGCCVATYFTFLPSFLFILLGAPFVESARGEARLTAALSGITAAVVGVILNLAVSFAQAVFLPQGAGEATAADWTTRAWQFVAGIDWLALALAAAALVALVRYRVNVAYVVLAAAVAGLTLHGLGWSG
jgi:chromate transporter